MFRFLQPHPDGSVTDVAIGGSTLADAFEQYREFYWSIETTGAVGVWHNSFLCARVLPVFNADTQQNEPWLQVWK